MRLRWHFYQDLKDIAEDLDLELYSQDGRCITLVLPEDLRQRYWSLLWTPLNHLPNMMHESWTHNIEDLFEWDKDREDFHFEFALREHAECAYEFFPEINYKSNDDITRDDIHTAVARMLDRENFDKHLTMAILRSQEE